MKWTLYAVVAVGLLLGLSGAASASSYSLSVGTNSPSYSGNASITVSGQVTPAPGVSSAVLVRVFDPSMNLTTADEAPVNATTGLYNCTFVAGGSSLWIDGTYTVNATWGALGPVIFTTTTFSWSSSAISTTTSTTSESTTATSTAPTTLTTSTTTSSVNSTSVTTSSATPPSTTASVQTSSSTTSSSTTTSASSTSSGSVPEFPFQVLAVMLFSALVAGSYLLVRKHKGTPSLTHRIP